jgi:competence protein ComEC
MNPGERDNAVADRAERRLARIWTESPECVTTLDGGEASRFARAVAGVRQAAIDTARERLTPTVAPLVRAMLLGDASGLTEEDFDAYRHTGTIHLLVVSGFHVGLIAGAPLAMMVCGLLPRRVAYVASMVLVVFYVAIVGGQWSALRAGVVAVAVAAAALAGRTPVSINTLAGAAVIVFALSPGAWVAPGTRLSFLATAALLGVAAYAANRQAAVVPPLERLIRSTRSPAQRLRHRLGGWLTWGIGASVVVQIATGPLVASEFHLISPVAAPLSLLVSPLVLLQVVGGLAVFAGEALASVTGGAEGLIALPAWLASFASEWLDGTIKSAAAAPGSGIWTAGPSPWWVQFWTVWLAFAAAIATFWPHQRWLTTRLGLVLVTSAFVPTLWTFLTARDELRCSFLAVGHGSSTLIETPDGRVVLIDAGALAAPDRVTDVIARTLWARGLHGIDTLVLTHADTDHYNAVPGLLERFAIGSVVTTTMMFPMWIDPADHSGPAELARLLETADIPVRTVQSGDRWRISGAEFLVLHPDDIGVAGSDNANSLVLGLEYAGKRVLLPGDLETPGTEWLMRQEPYDCDLLLAPHHGSERSDPAGFSAWSLPEQVVVSSGEPRRVAQDSFTEVGAAVWETYDRGFITSFINAEGVRVAAWRPPASVKNPSGPSH